MKPCSSWLRLPKKERELHESPASHVESAGCCQSSTIPSVERSEVRSEGVDQSEEQGGVRDGSLESGSFLREKSFLSQLLL